MMHAQPPRPTPFQGDLRNLPAALDAPKALSNWVGWRFVWKVDKKGVGSWTKPPFRLKNPQRFAKNNDPSTWGTYEEALAAFEAGQCNGIGFNLLGTILLRSISTTVAIL
jgi:putative DNA primase/helicase